MADNKKTEELDFEKELAPHVFGATSSHTIEMGKIIHRRRGLRLLHKSGHTAYCSEWVFDLSHRYKSGTRYSDLCKKCLKSYSAEEIQQLKHFLVIMKLKGK